MQNRPKNRCDERLIVSGFDNAALPCVSDDGGAGWDKIAIILVVVSDHVRQS